MKFNLDLISRVLMSLMFALSVFGNLFMSGKFAGSVNYVKSIGFPLPVLSVIVGLLIKGFGAYSLITKKYVKYALPLLILFTVSVTILFNNPLKDKSKKWMFFTLVSVIGSLIQFYLKNKDN